MNTDPVSWNVDDILALIAVDALEVNVILCCLFALGIGIIIGGMFKGIAKIMLVITVLSGFALLILAFLGKQDLLTIVL